MAIFGDLSLDGMTDAPECAFVMRRAVPEAGTPQQADDLGITVLDQGEIKIGGAALFHWAWFDGREERISSALYAADEPVGETGKYLNIAIAGNGPVPEMAPVIQSIFLMSVQFYPTQAAGTTQGGKEGPETGRVAENGDAGPAQDSFVDIGGEYTTCRNGRYGTKVSYPGTDFIAQPASGRAPLTALFGFDFGERPAFMAEICSSHAVFGGLSPLFFGWVAGLFVDVQSKAGPSFKRNRA